MNKICAHFLNTFTTILISLSITCIVALYSDAITYIKNISNNKNDMYVINIVEDYDWDNIEYDYYFFNTVYFNSEYNINLTRSINIYINDKKMYIDKVKGTKLEVISIKYGKLVFVEKDKSKINKIKFEYPNNLFFILE